MMTASAGIRIAGLVLVLGALAGCKTLGVGPEAIKSFYCGTDTRPGAYVPVRWSVNDTDETIAQTKANNAVYKATC